MIRREDLPECPVVAVYGDLDFSNVTPFAESLETLAAEPVVIVSLEHATFIDSSVLSALLRRHREKVGAVVVVLPEDNPLGRIFDVTGLRGLLNVAPDLVRARRIAAAERGTRARPAMPRDGLAVEPNLAP